MDGFSTYLLLSAHFIDEDLVNGD